MEKYEKFEVTLEGFCKLFNFYIEDMENGKLLLGPVNNVIGMIDSTNFKIMTYDEQIVCEYYEKENKGIISYQITSINQDRIWKRIVGSLATVENDRTAIEVVEYDYDGNKILKLITGCDNDYFYVKDYKTREVSCMLKSTPRTDTCLKHITKCHGEKAWKTYMEIARAKAVNDNVNVIYESVSPFVRIKGNRIVTNDWLIDFGNIAHEINPRMQEFFKDIRSRLELSQVNLFDRAITTSLEYIDSNSLVSLFRTNFEKEKADKDKKIKTLYYITN